MHIYGCPPVSPEGYVCTGVRGPSRGRAFTQPGSSPCCPTSLPLSPLSPAGWVPLPPCNERDGTKHVRLYAPFYSKRESSRLHSLSHAILSLFRAIAYTQSPCRLFSGQQHLHVSTSEPPVTYPTNSCKSHEDPFFHYTLPLPLADHLYTFFFRLSRVH